MGTLDALHAEYGDAVGIGVGPRKALLLARPEHARHVLVRQHRRYVKGDVFARLVRITGEGVLFAEGDAWRRQRRMVVPAFQRARIEALLPFMVEATQDLLARWEREHADGKPFELLADTSRVALDVVSRSMFGTDLRDRAATFHAHNEQAVAYANWLLNTLLPPPLWVPTRRNREVRGMRRWLHGLFAEMIAAHRAADPTPDDLLGLLLRVRDEETGEGLTDRELSDELMTFVNAGHETTAVTLAWTLHRLGDEPEWERRLHAEVDAVLGDAAPTLETLERLERTERILRESLRLDPPGPVLPRQALEEDRVGDVLVPASASILISAYHLHRHPEFWSDPERFDPDRFLPERGEPRHAMAYLPFGLGGRRCLGEDFAMLEMKTVLAMIARRFRVRSVPGHPVERHVQLTLRPRHGLRVTLKPRAPGQS